MSLLFKKYWWVCEKGHSYEQVAYSKIKGIGCPYCSGKLAIKGVNDLITTHPEHDIDKDLLCEKNNVRLIRIREKGLPQINTNSITYEISENNNTSYSYINCALKFLEDYLNINLNYNINNDFDDILKLINFIEKETCISKTNPEVLKEWDYEKNDLVGITPENMTNGSSLKVWWKCEKGHEYLVTISTKIRQNTKCPYCSSKKILRGYNDLATTHPALLKDWNYEKNDKLGIFPNKIIAGSSIKVWWKCEKGHEWVTSVNNRTNQNTGCPYCSNRKVLEGYNDLATTHPELLKEWNYEKNDKLGIFPNKIIAGSSIKVWWKCSKGHEWSVASVKRITQNTKCPYCSKTRVLYGFNDVVTLVPNLLKELDTEKNNDINLREIGKGSRIKLWWKCNKNHSYEATISNRLKGTSCPYCSGHKVLKRYNDLATTHPEVLKDWNYEKNEINGITPYNISKSYSKKVWWKCEKGHEYQREVYNQRNGYAKCPICKKKNNNQV